MPPAEPPPPPHSRLPRHLAITGARGRLATSLIAELRARGLRVTGLSRTPGEGHLAYADLPALQVRDPIDCLLHLAWSSLPATAELPGHDPAQDIALIDALFRDLRGAPVAPHFVFFSSGGAVYGNATQPSRETDPCHPIGRYGQSKLAAEEHVLAHQAEGPCAVLRISNPYGFPWSGSRPQGIVPRTFACAWSGETLQLWGDGSAEKDFLHRDDFLPVLLEVLARRLAGIYNVAAGESHRVDEVLACIERETGRRIQREHVAAKPWDVHTSRLDISRIRAATDWTPVVGLAEGIRRTKLHLLEGRTP